MCVCVVLRERVLRATRALHAFEKQDDSHKGNARRGKHGTYYWDSLFFPHPKLKLFVSAGEPVHSWLAGRARTARASRR